MFRTAVAHTTSAGWIRPQLTLLILTLLLTLLIPAGPARASKDLPTQAREHVAAKLGLPLEQLSIVAEDRAILPLSKLERIDYKVAAPDGRTFGVSYNATNNTQVDAASTELAEQELRVKAFGVIDPELHGRMQAGGSDQGENLAVGARIPVAIWLHPSADPVAHGASDRSEQAIAARGASLRNAQAPIMQALKGLGAESTGADLAPLVFADLTPGQIKALAQRGDIASIEAIPQDLQSFNDDIGTSDRFSYAWPYTTGTGATVAVHEDDGVDTANVFLVGPTFWCTGVGTGPGGSACTKGTNIGSHATNVAGVVASTHAWRRGGAYGIAAGNLFSANFQSFSSPQNIVNSLTWALSSGADVVNMSWGGCTNGAPNFYTRVVDYLVRVYGDNLVISSGNIPNCSGSLYVAAPSLAWNSISVGSYYDNNTGLRTDDVFSNFTEWKNPTDPVSGRTYEKPDITAMGGQTSGGSCFGVETTGVGASTFNSTCGTSFSAPDASSLAALIVSKQPSLRNRTESVKAILMAGATHNITDNAGWRSCPSAPVAGDCRDGAGAIDAYQTIQRIVTPGNWAYTGAITPDSFSTDGYISYPVTIGLGRNIRAALAWDSSVSCTSLGTGSQTCGTDVLNADLDLQLVNPSGTVVATSSSFQNSAEVLDYKTTASGTYTLRIRKFRFDAGTSTYAGVAWNLNTVDAFTPLTGYTPLALNTLVTGQTTNLKTSYWDKYSGPGIGTCGAWPETGLEKVYRITTTKTGTIRATLSSIVGFAGVGSNVDVFILKAGRSANALNTQVVGCGSSIATATAQPAGVYYVVVDGYNGSVANFSLKVTLS